MIAKEVLSIRFARGTEEDKEVDHTYKVVSLEANKGGRKGTTSATGGHCIHMMCMHIQTGDRWLIEQAEF